MFTPFSSSLLGFPPQWLVFKTSLQEVFEEKLGRQYSAFLGRQEKPPETNDTGPVFGQFGVQVASHCIYLELAIKLQ